LAKKLEEYADTELVDITGEMVRGKHSDRNTGKPINLDVYKDIEAMKSKYKKEEYILSSTGAIKGLFSNLLLALKRLGTSSKLKYNEFSRMIEYENRNLEDLDLINFRDEVNREIEADFKTPEILQATHKLSSENSYNPIKQMIESKEWDKTERVETFFIDYLGAEDSEYTRTLAKRWLTGAVARVYEPGIKFEVVPIFHGKQGIGKSTIGDKLAGEYFTDSLKGMTNKDDLLILAGKWIVELSELSAMGETRIEEVKSFISARTDTFRVPYDKLPKDHNRTIVFFGTTNTPQFLKDVTGDRRFFPVSCKPNASKDIFNISKETIQQLWAEAYEYYKNDTRIFYTEEEQDYIEENYRKDVRYEDELLNQVTHFINLEIPKDFYKLQTYEQKKIFNDGYYYKGDSNIKVTGFQSKIEKFHTRDLLKIIGYEPLKPNFNSLMAKVNMYMNNFDEWEYKPSLKINGRVTSGYVKRK